MDITKFKTFVESKKKMRTRMINANYPGIRDESVTTQFMVDLLAQNLQFQHFAEMLNEMLPPTIQQFANRFRSKYSSLLPFRNDYRSLGTSSVYPMPTSSTYSNITSEGFLNGYRYHQNKAN